MIAEWLQGDIAFVISGISASSGSLALSGKMSSWPEKVANILFCGYPGGPAGPRAPWSPFGPIGPVALWSLLSAFALTAGRSRFPSWSLWPWFSWLALTTGRSRFSSRSYQSGFTQTRSIVCVPRMICNSGVVFSLRTLGGLRCVLKIVSVRSSSCAEEVWRIEQPICIIVIHLESPH